MLRQVLRPLWLCMYMLGEKSVSPLLLPIKMYWMLRNIHTCVCALKRWIVSSQALKLLLLSCIQQNKIKLQKYWETSNHALSTNVSRSVWALFSSYYFSQPAHLPIDAAISWHHLKSAISSIQSSWCHPDVFAIAMICSDAFAHVHFISFSILALGIFFRMHMQLLFSANLC